MDPASTSKLHSQLISKLREAGNYDAFVKKFSACATDTERVACLLSLPEAQTLFPVAKCFSPKNERDAELLRAEGNKFFKSKDYPAAFLRYTKSIISAPNNFRISGLSKKLC